MGKQLAKASKVAGKNPARPAIKFKEAIKLTKIELIEKLYELPKLIEDAENAVIKDVQAIQGAKERLADEQDRLLTNGSIDGKNAEIRAAQLRERTGQEVRGVQQAENKASISKVKLNRLNNELRSSEAIAGMLKGAE